MSRARGVRALTERLRAIAEHSRRRNDATDGWGRTRIRIASFERGERGSGKIWVPPEPTRRWFEDQGIIPVEQELKPKNGRWWR